MNNCLFNKQSEINSDAKQIFDLSASYFLCIFPCIIGVRGNCKISM